MKQGRKNHSTLFKAKVALEALKGEETTAEVAMRLQVHPSQVRTWRRSFLKRAVEGVTKTSCPHVHTRRQSQHLVTFSGQTGRYTRPRSLTLCSRLL